MICENVFYQDLLNFFIIIDHENYEVYCTIKPLTPNNIEKIRQAKTWRESLGGENNHADQCFSIPDIIDESKHRVHSTPCYKKFTLVLSKKRVSEINITPGSEQRQLCGYIHRNVIFAEKNGLNEINNFASLQLFKLQMLKQQ